MGALKSAVGVAVIAALVMLVRPVHPGATWSPSWMKLTAFSHGTSVPCPRPPHDSPLRCNLTLARSPLTTQPTHQRLSASM